MSITPASGEIRRLRKEIDRLLDEYRPDRYIVRVRDEPEQDDTETENGIPDLNPLLDDTETKPGAEWLDSVAAMAVSYAPMTTDPRVLYVRKVVGEREGVATKRANQLLRTIKQSGQLVLGWWGVENNPVAITWRIVEKGKRPRITDERVALRAMNPTDFRQFAIVERQRALDNATRVVLACDGADWIADQMIKAGQHRFHEWAESVIPLPVEDPPETGQDPA